MTFALQETCRDDRAEMASWGWGGIAVTPFTGQVSSGFGRGGVVGG